MTETPDAAKRLKSKQDFYESLESLEQEDDDIYDIGRHASVKAMQNASKTALDAIKYLPRSASDTEVPTANNGRLNSQNGRPKSASGVMPRTLTKGHPFSSARRQPVGVPAPLSSAESKVLGKRRRESSIKLAPDNQQIFKGLHFYFFPNNDSNPARAMRITKALEFGATWQRHWSESVTHIIADRTMDYGSLLKFLEVEGVPPEVIVVSETYPSECLSYRMILDPMQPQFRVKGCPPPGQKQVKQPEKDKGAGSTNSSQSLQLKPPGKAVLVREPETPKKDEPVSSKQRVTSTHDVESPAAAGSCEKVLPAAESRIEFDAVIEEVRELKPLPIDQDDDSPNRPTSSSGSDPAREEPESDIELTEKHKTKFQRIQDKFQCMHKHTGDKTETSNAATVSILQQMADHYGNVGDEWRTRAYRKAIATLRNHPTKFWTKEQALSLPQIGERLATKIEETAFTARLRRLDNARAEPTDQALQNFMQIYGAGSPQASKWVGQSYTTLNELLEKADLTEIQRIGIEHFEDFNSRAPRAEIEKHGAIAQEASRRIDSSLELILGGSYRHGSQTSGDIDCIITRPGKGAESLRLVVFDRLVPQLTESGFLVTSLAASNRDDGRNGMALPVYPIVKFGGAWIFCSFHLMS